MERESPDLVLLDINLPGEDGLYLTRQLRAKLDVGIILVTGRTDDVDRIVGLELGADDYVTKPFNQRELLARVKNLLRRTLAARREDEAPTRFAGWVFDTTGSYHRAFVTFLGVYAASALILVFLRVPKAEVERVSAPIAREASEAADG